METILTFANTVSPIGVIALLIIVILQLVGNKSITSFIGGKKEVEEKPGDEHLVTMQALLKQNETLLNNHFKHEIPDMVTSIARIESKVDTVIDTQNIQGNRITRLETLQEK